MNIKSCFAALGLCLLPLCSQAGVVYEWHALNDETPRGITLALEFDDSIVNSGGFVLNIDEEASAGEPRPDVGAFTLRYSFPGKRGAPAMTYSVKDGFGNGYGLLDIDVSFDANGFLSGHIYANNSEHHFDMGSTGRWFTVFDANSDAGMPSAGCEWGMECAGAVGEIRRADVPEPGSLALLGAGLIAAAGLRRKSASPAA